MSDKLPSGERRGQEHVASPTSADRSSEIRSLLAQAVAFHRAGLIREADQIYRTILQIEPSHFDSLHLLGVTHFQSGDHAVALREIDAALAVNPRSADAHHNRGNVLLGLKRFEEAVASYERAIALKPDNAEAMVSGAHALHELGRFHDALASCDRAIAARPDYPEAWYNRGNALAALQRREEACAAYDRTIALKPNDAGAFNNRGAVWQVVGQFERALADFDRAIALNPEHAQAHNNRGLVLAELKRFDEAVASFERAIAIDPHYAGAINNLGTVLQQLGRIDAAFAAFDQAIGLDPGYAQAFYNRGTALQGMGRLAEAVGDYERALTLDPDQRNLAGELLHAKMHLCQWRDYQRDCSELLRAIDGGRPIAHPFALLAIPSSPLQQRRCAELYVNHHFPAASEPRQTRRKARHQPGPGARHDRIRLCYLSADFHDHATTHLMAGMFENHDHARFETTALSFGPPSGSRERTRLLAAFERFLDVRMQSDQSVVELMRTLEIDIAVDLKGFTQDARTGILVRRPAPVQVSYLGYPGTMGARFIDYLIADRFVIPDEQWPSYSEKVVWLPECYQVNDAKRPISALTSSRASTGLPEDAFVFCCFNASYKITPELFDVWMRLLRDIPTSVLWLIAGRSHAPDNLRREAQARGVVPDRLIFAPVTRSQEHLARHQLADLFLDTHPYNAHTTASDALWAGLPVLTYAGETFAGRVAGSLLQAVGLSELVTLSLEDYEALARELASNPARLAALRQRLAHNITTASLFDTVRTTRHVEAAFATMWERHCRDEPPQAFAVTPLP